MKTQIQDIIDRGDKTAIIPFLQSLPKEKRKELVPIIKREEKKYRSYEIRQQPGIWDKVEILRIAGFICYEGTDAKGLRPWDLPKMETLEELLEWHSPAWFSDLVNTAEVFYERTYSRVVRWQDRGFIQLDPQAIPNIMADSIIYWNRESRQTIYTTEELEKYPVTLDEHIWYFFQYPSTIDSADKRTCKDIDYKKETGNWCYTFKKYIRQGRLDRMRVLRECLMVVNRNFNKTQTGWFMTLLSSLEPTTEELLSLQDELFATLTSIHSKPINTTLNYFKKLYTYPEFQRENLIPYFPALLNSEVKSIVQVALGLIEGLLKSGTTHSEELCAYTCNAFLSKDEAVQKKAAEIIVKYASDPNTIKEAMLPVSDNLLMSIKPLLKDYLPDNLNALNNDSIDDQTGIDDDTVSVSPLVSNENQIPRMQSFEDFAFFISQALDASEVHHLDLLMNALPVWGNQVTEDTLILLEPAFQKVFRQITRGNIPLEGIVLDLVYSYMLFLEKKYPKAFEKLSKQKQKAVELEKERINRSERYKGLLKRFENLNVSFCLSGFQQIGIYALNKLIHNDTLPLLSTPTHLPTWIDPVVLVNRMSAYQENKQEPNDMDLQLALQRCALDNTSEALALAKIKLNGELKELMLFFLDPNAAPKGKYEHPAWWMTAGITRSPGIRFPEFSSFGFTIPDDYLYVTHQWESYTKHYMAYGSYNSEKGGYDRYPATRAALQTSTPEYTNTKQPYDLFMQYLFNTDLHHIEYILLAAPYLPDDIYGDIMLRLSAWSYVWEVAEQELATTGISIMQQLHTPFREMHYFLLAGCLLASHKTARDYAVQIWIDRVSTDSIDNSRVGKAIGKMETLELAPLKRFTDILSSNMIGISKRHNKAALELVEAIFPELTAEPIKNVKKLLELYSELLALNNVKASSERTPRLNDWLNEGSLKKIVKQLLNS